MRRLSSAERKCVDKRQHDISFEEVIDALEEEDFGSIPASNRKKYPNQTIVIVEIKEYACLPTVENEQSMFLKTAFPNRKYTKNNLKTRRRHYEKEIHSSDSYEKEINDAIERGQVHNFRIAPYAVKYARLLHIRRVDQKRPPRSLRIIGILSAQSRGQRFALSDAHRHDSSPRAGQSHGYAVVSDFTFSAVAIQSAGKSAIELP